MLADRTAREHAPRTIDQPPGRKSSHRWIFIACLSILAILAIAAFLLVRNWPFTRQAITSALQDRSARTVQIRSFRQTFFPPGCVAEGVSFLRHQHPDRPPLITIQKLIIEGSYARLITFSKHVDQVHVTGMHVTVPPRGPGPDGRQHSVIPLTQNKSGRSLTIGKIVAGGALLEFMPGQAGKEPYRLQVQKLELEEVGNHAPLIFRAMLFNSEPPGEIHASGKVGPWNADDPGRTPVSGSYTMDDAKLGVFHGISGTLSSKGMFSGALDRVEVDGATDIPDFHVTRSTHTNHLTISFHAIVNGTDGDTLLQNVQSRLLHTTVLSEGSVAGKAGRKGKTAELDMAVRDGRIEDLLRLFVKAKRPAMSGAVSLRAKVELPSDARPFLHKLWMEGDFGIGGGKLANTGRQDAVNKISESARGEKKEQQETDPQTVLSNLKGHVVVRNGIAMLSKLSFSVPGALAEMSGTYNLLNEQVDLHGTLETNGKLSDATSGFKSLMLKVINPFFKKKSGVKFVPFKITGTYGHPILALDFGRKK